MDSEVSELLGDEEGKLTEVILTSGRTLKADILVAGLGVLPSTDFLRDSDVFLDSRGFVPVDEVTFPFCFLSNVDHSKFYYLFVSQYMRTNCKDIYAVGDIASFPVHEKESDEHKNDWQIDNNNDNLMELTKNNNTMTI